MNWSKRGIIQGVIGAAAIACFAVAMHYMHKSGCAGDLKTGSVGDPTLALQLEGQGIIWGVAGAGLLALLAASFPGRSAPVRVGLAIGVAALGYILLIAGTVQVETEAIRSCF